jgi:hypothetical protein
MAMQESGVKADKVRETVHIEGASHGADRSLPICRKDRRSMSI